MTQTHTKTTHLTGLLPFERSKVRLNVHLHIQKLQNNSNTTFKEGSEQKGGNTKIAHAHTQSQILVHASVTAVGFQTLQMQLWIFFVVAIEAMLNSIKDKQTN